MNEDVIDEVLRWLVPKGFASNKDRDEIIQEVHSIIRTFKAERKEKSLSKQKQDRRRSFEVIARALAEAAKALDERDDEFDARMYDAGVRLGLDNREGRDDIVYGRLTDEWNFAKESQRYDALSNHLKTIASAADKEAGKPYRPTGERKPANVTLSFLAKPLFEKYRPDEANTSDTGPFRSFVESLYELATGHSASPAELERPVKTAFRTKRTPRDT